MPQERKSWSQAHRHSTDTDTHRQTQRHQKWEALHQSSTRAKKQCHRCNLLFVSSGLSYSRLLQLQCWEVRQVGLGSS